MNKLRLREKDLQVYRHAYDLLHKGFVEGQQPSQSDIKRISRFFTRPPPSLDVVELHSLMWDLIPYEHRDILAKAVLMSGDKKFNKVSKSRNKQFLKENPKKIKNIVVRQKEKLQKIDYDVLKLENYKKNKKEQKLVKNFRDWAEEEFDWFRGLEKFDYGPQFFKTFDSFIKHLYVPTTHKLAVIHYCLYATHPVISCLEMTKAQAGPLDEVDISTQQPSSADVETEDSTDKHGKTFTNVVNAESAVVSKLNALDIKRDLISNVTEQEKSIQDFLAVPRIMYQDSLSTSDSGVKTFFRAPSEIFTNYTVLKEKVNGFLGMRATLCFKLQINSSPFVSGRYRLCFLHNGGISNTGTGSLDTYWYAMHVYSKVQASQLYGVDIDVGCQSEVTLKVPFISSEPSYPTRRSYYDGPGDIGRLILYTYSPIRYGAGTVAPKYTLWAYFEDVDLLGPTYAQMNTKELNEMTGPISGPAKTISTVSGMLAKFPHLTPYAQPVKWAADIVGGVASSFGYSRPANEGPINRVKRSTMAPMQHADVVDTTQKLSFMNTYHIESAPGFAGSDIDEMSFKYLNSIWSYFGGTTFTTGTSAGTKIFEVTVTPFNYTEETDGSAVVTNWAPYSAVAKCFKFWRGSIEYRFKLVKTQFHSGRLLVVYTPKDNRFTNSDPAFNLKLDGQSLVVDFKESSEFTVKCPYIANVPWSFPSSTSGNGAKLEIFVLDPIQAPTTVSDTVALLAEHRGGPDFEVGGDFANDFVDAPYVPTAPQSAWRPGCEIIEETLGGEIQMSDAYNRAMIGERILSFRTLVKKPCKSVDDINLSGYTYLTFQPYQCKMPTQSDHTASTTFNMKYDYITLLTSMYALSRGGVSMKVIPQYAGANYTSSNNSARLDAMWTADTVFSANFGWYGNSNLTPLYTRNPSVMGNWSIGDAPEITVPGSNVWLSRPNAELINNTQVFTGLYHVQPLNVQFEIRGNGALTTDRVSVFRYGADDFEVGCFVSVPPFYNRAA